MSDDKKSPSMSDFDYFSDDVVPAGWESVDGDEASQPSGLEAQLQAYRTKQRRYSRSLVLMVVTFMVASWAVWTERDQISYAFADNIGPREIGDVINALPDQMPHNTYVHLTGITEHRAVQRTRFARYSLKTQEYWYFRLVGSRGVFIETINDFERFGTMTKVDVRGRVIDPRRDSIYDVVLDHYHHEYKAERRPNLRVIQVDVLPGDGRTFYTIIFGFLSLLLLSNLLVFRSLMNVRRQLQGGRLPSA